MVQFTESSELFDRRKNTNESTQKTASKIYQETSSLDSQNSGNIAREEDENDTRYELSTPYFPGSWTTFNEEVVFRHELDSVSIDPHSSQRNNNVVDVNSTFEPENPTYSSNGINQPDSQINASIKKEEPETIPMDKRFDSLNQLIGDLRKDLFEKSQQDNEQALNEQIKALNQSILDMKKEFAERLKNGEKERDRLSKTYENEKIQWMETLEALKKASERVNQPPSYTKLTDQNVEFHGAISDLRFYISFLNSKQDLTIKDIRNSKIKDKLERLTTIQTSLPEDERNQNRMAFESLKHDVEHLTRNSKTDVSEAAVAAFWIFVIVAFVFFWKASEDSQD